MSNSTKSCLQEEDFSKIRNAIDNNSSVEFSCCALTPANKKRFLDVLSTFLDECGQSDLFTALSYCLIELLDNASKANAKRIYFQKNKLNINDSKDYELGMKSFKTTLNENVSDFFEEDKDGFLQVKLKLSTHDNLYMKVINNTKITEKEYERILAKIEKTAVYNSMQDAITDIDVTEGCGLGIVSIILLLKSLGLSKDNLTFNIAGELTEAAIKIPLDVYGELETL